MLETIFHLYDSAISKSSAWEHAGTLRSRNPFDSFDIPVTIVKRLSITAHQLATLLKINTSKVGACEMHEYS